MNPIAIYDMIDVAYPYRLRGGGNTQGDVGLIYPPPMHTLYSVSGVGPASTSATRLGQLAIGGFSLHNRANTTQGGIAIGVRIPNSLWRAGQWDDATTTYTDDTTDAQDAGGADFPLETTTTSDGFVILSRVPFNGISIDVSTTSVGGAPDRAARYSAVVSSTDSWISLSTNIYSSVATTGNYVITGATHANEGVWAFGLPNDFAATVADDALGTGIESGYYALNIRATTAPTGTAGVADSLSIYRLYFLTEGLADNGIYEAFFGSSELLTEAKGDALVAFFNTADDGNRVTAFVRSKG